MAAPAAAKPSHEAVNQVLAAEVILPAYEAYQASMAALAPALEPLCAAADPTALATARDAYQQAMASWQVLQPIAFGPVVSEGALSRIQFWPDKHGTAGRQLRKALAAKDPALIA